MLWRNRQITLYTVLVRDDSACAITATLTHKNSHAIHVPFAHLISITCGMSHAQAFRSYCNLHHQNLVSIQIYENSIPMPQIIPYLKKSDKSNPITP
jgi:hypothetical protein